MTFNSKFNTPMGKLEDYLCRAIEKSLLEDGWEITDICPDGIYIRKDDTEYCINPLSIEKVG